MIKSCVYNNVYIVISINGIAIIKLYYRKGNDVMAQEIDFDKIYECANPLYGTFKIIEDLGVIKKQRMVKIKFINTGNEKTVRWCHARDGNVRDTMKDIDFNKDYESKRCGTFKIIEILPNAGVGRVRMVRIKFNNTGYIKDVRLEHAKTGNVADDSIPSVLGVGWCGNVKEEHKDVRHWYKIWVGMLSRCYNEKDSNYHLYGEKGVTVCDRWHVFENFLEDIKHIPGYPEAAKRPGGYQLDKDYSQFYLPHDKRVYSKETCRFLTDADNVGLVSANSPHFIDLSQYTVNPVTILKPMVKIVKKDI